MSVVIGLSGKMGSGKDTCGNYLLGMVMQSIGLCQTFALSEEGNLYISDIDGDTSYEGRFDVHRRSPTFESFRRARLDKHIRVYKCAGYLKDEVCADILGIPVNDLYVNKDAPTHLKWENMPGVVTPERVEKAFYGFWTDASTVEEEDFPALYTKLTGQIIHEPGPMTSREVQQFVGTEVFRKMYASVWIDALKRRIQREQPTLALITDIRFPDEAEGVYDINGKVVRLLREVSEEEKTEKHRHPSETMLDNYTNFSKVLDNRNQERRETLSDLHKYISGLGVDLPFIIQ